MWKETLLPTKRMFGTVAVTWVIFFVVQKGKALCERQFASYRQQPEMGKQNVDVADQWKNFCERLCCLCYNVISALYCALNNHSFCYSSTLCCNLLVGMSLNVRLTTKRECMKTYTHIHVAWTSEEWSPYIFNVYEFFKNSILHSQTVANGPRSATFALSGSNL